jgi:hypothetical protein
MYLMLEEAQAPADQWSAGVVYTLLRKVLRNPTAKPPFYKRLTLDINQDMKDAYRTRLHGAVETLVSARVRLDRGADPHRVAFFQPGWQCATCPFKLPCDLMQTTPQGAEAMLADLYTEGDPWARYMQGQGEDASDASASPV